MHAALRMTAEVQPGGKIEVVDAQLPIGQSVEVIVLLPSLPVMPQRSIVEILAEASGHLEFETAEEVDMYVREERHAWER